MDSIDNLRRLAEYAHTILIDYATGKAQDENEYRRIRQDLIANIAIRDRLPSTLRDLRGLLGSEGLS